jgi:hypothetical protein
MRRLKKRSSNFHNDRRCMSADRIAIAVQGWPVVATLCPKPESKVGWQLDVNRNWMPHGD